MLQRPAAAVLSTPELLAGRARRVWLLFTAVALLIVLAVSLVVACVLLLWLRRSKPAFFLPQADLPGDLPPLFDERRIPPRRTVGSQ